MIAVPITVAATGGTVPVTAAGDPAIALTPALTAPVTPFVIRPDAERVKVVTWDKMLTADLGVTIPNYSTTAKTLRASEALDTYTVDLTHYDYYVIIRALTIPVYSITTRAKGREEYACSSFLYEVTRIPANTFSAIIEPNRKYGSAMSIVTGQAIHRDVYYSASTTLAVYTAITYAMAINVTAPSLSGSTLTINSGSVAIRGHTTYLVNTYYNAMEDARLQLVAEIWRARKTSLDTDGWGGLQNTLYIAECAQSETHKLR